MRKWLTSFGVLLAATAGANSAGATAFTPQTLLTTFNVISHGNLATTSDIEGNVLVGGNTSGNGILASNFPGIGTPTPPTGYGQINIFQNNSGTWAEATQKVFVGGANTGNFGAAIPTVGYTFPGAGGSPGEGSNTLTFNTDIWAPLTALSASLGMLGNNSTFNPATGAFTTAVKSQTAAQLESAQANLSFPSCFSGSNPTCDGVVNVTGDYNTGMIGFTSNIIQYRGIIFNFVDAMSLSFENGWEASVLAPFADVQVTNHPLEGTLAANSVGASAPIGVEIHNFLFDCSANLCTPVLMPEPGSLALLGTAFACLGVLYYRRRFAGPGDALES